MMKKRRFSLLLALLLLFSPLSVSAAEDTPYLDVSMGDWYFQPVTFCTELGLMNGIGGAQFSPGGSINRAMFVTILHRLAGSPAAEPGGFSDVPADSFYAQAVAWAEQEGIVNGTGETTFSPAQHILRQDMACMLARYLIHVDSDLLYADACEQAFLDIDQVSGYAKDSVELMRRTGLFRGDEASNFRPLDTANRAEAATLFTRLALAMGIIPRQAVLESEGECCTLTVEDTIWMYTFLTNLPWIDGMYAEYIPTHTLTLWNGEYRFYLPEGDLHNGVNYVCGSSHLGSHQINPTSIQLLYQCFTSYLP